MKLPDLSAEDARAWMEKAKIDLLSARALLDNEIISSALFHTQQAAEKSLKAFLTWHQTPFRRVHDLEELGAICETIDGSLSGTVRQSEPLTAYAWKLRYPGEAFEPDNVEAEEFLAVAKLVYDEVLRRLPQTAHPNDEGDAPLLG